MSKTVDELHEIYRNARLGEIFAAKDEELVTDVRERAERAGIAAVVRALRDEVDRIWIDEDMGCGTILDVFNQILGDAGVQERHLTVQEQNIIHSALRRSVKVAGAERVGTPTSAVAQAKTPATAPAPDVCEWRDDAYIGCFTTSCSDDAAWNRLGGTPKDEGYNFCPSCGKPIKFTEAK